MIEDMFISFDIDKIRTRKLLIATPMYGGQCTGEFCLSLFETGRVLTKNNIPHDFQDILGESLITRARNFLADHFVRSDNDYMLFIDSDIGFEPNAVLTLLNHAVNRDDMEIICGAYPLKKINWPAISFAAENKMVPQELLHMFTADYFINYEDPNAVIKLSEPAKILYGGTGFMLIKKSVFHKIKEKRPDLLFSTAGNNNLWGFDIPDQMMAYFECGIHPQTRQYLSEDYMFSELAREVGVSTWFVPNIDLKHVGSYTYSGSLRNISYLQERAMKAQAQQNT